MFLGGPGRNRTTDTRIFKYSPIGRFRFDFKGLSHQSRLVKKLCVLVPVKFGNEIRIMRGAIFLCVQIVLPFLRQSTTIVSCNVVLNDITSC